MNTNCCDRCGSAGKTRFTKGDSELIFCGHHGREYGFGLVNEGFQFDAEYAADNDESLVNA